MTEPRVYRPLALLAALLALVLWSAVATAQTLVDPPFARIGKGPLNQAMYSPDGALLAVPGRDGIWLYDPSTLEQIGFLGGHQGMVWSVAFSADGRYLVSGGEDRTVRLWDMTARREIVAWEGHQSPVFCVAFSPDGRLCASGSNNSSGNEVRLWDVENRQALGVLANYGGAWVFAVAFSPDGQHLAVATGKGSQGQVQIWEVATWKIAKELRAYPRDIADVVFSPDGQYLALACADRTLRLLDAATYQELTVFYDPNAWALAFSPDSRYLATSPSGNIYDVQQQHQVLSLSLAALGIARSSVSFSPTGDHLALAVGGEIYWPGYTRSSWLRVWSWRPDQPAEQWPTGIQNIRYQALGPGGHLLALAADSTISLWDRAQRRVYTTLRGDAGEVRSLAFSADGRTLAYLTYAGGVRLWDLEKGGPGVLLSVARREQISMWPGRRVAFSPDGRLLAFSTDAPLFNQVVLWDLAAQREIARLQGHQGSVIWMGFSPDSRFLASGGFSEEVWLWDTARGEPANPQPYRGEVAAFSPDGKLLAVGQYAGAVQLWDREEGRQLGVLERGTTTVNWMEFSADGKLLLVHNEGAPLRLWDLESQRFLKELEGGADWMAFSADHRTLATGSRDSKVILWGARPSPIETAVATAALPLPLRPALLPAYPNPFNGQVVIPYRLAQEGRATLVIYNLAGQVVRTLVGKAQPPGLYAVLWDGRDEAGRELASGVYCYRLETAHWAETRKVLVLR